MLRRILVYEDALADQHPALQRAMQLSRQHKAPLKVIDIVDGPSDALRELHRPMRSLVEQQRKDRLDEICQPLADLDIELKTELIRGRPFTEVVREVVHEGSQLVIKTAAAAERTDVMGIMGPVDLRLVRNCPCPVWLEAPGREVRLDRILVAIDPQTEDDELNRVLLEMAVLLAKSAGAELHIASAWEVPDEDFLTEKLRADKLAQFADDLRSAAQESLDALLVQADKPVAAGNVHFRKGNPARTILNSVQMHLPDLLVIGTVNHTNVGGLLIGNTADTVLRQIGCSVLAVKPHRLFHA